MSGHMADLSGHRAGGNHGTRGGLRSTPLGHSQQIPSPDRGISPSCSPAPREHTLRERGIPVSDTRASFAAPQEPEGEIHGTGAT
jgi:hypothetical protein